MRRPFSHRPRGPRLRYPLCSLQFFAWSLEGTERLRRLNSSAQISQSCRLILYQRFPLELAMRPHVRIDRIADVRPRSKVVLPERIEVSIVAGQWVSEDAALRQCNRIWSPSMAKTHRSRGRFTAMARALIGLGRHPDQIICVSTNEGLWCFRSQINAAYPNRRSER